MNRIIILCFALLGAGIVWAQDAPKKKVAVYVTGGSDMAVNKVVGAQLVAAIVSNGTYQAIERTADFLKQITAEQKYQQSGSVADDQISRLGKQMGVNYVCVADVTNVLGSTFIQARLIDVENANIMATGEDDGSLSDMASLKKIATAITDKLLGTGNSRTTATTPQRSSGNTLSFTVRGVSFEMVKVEGGDFRMGCTNEQGGDCSDDENPAHWVTLSSYYMGKTEVTQSLWEAVMGSTVRDMYNKRDKQDGEYKWNQLAGEGDTYPMYFVSWEDCQSFINELNRLTASSRPSGKQFALPTEAQWEYAARGGNKQDGTKYAGSNSEYTAGWFEGNSGASTHAVAQKVPNGLGIYDMSGNVWEWCSDWYGSYSSGSQTDPVGAYSGSSRVLRGGSWSYTTRNCRVANRSNSAPSHRYSSYGFRLSLVQ